MEEEKYVLKEDFDELAKNFNSLLEELELLNLKKSAEFEHLQVNLDEEFNDSEENEESESELEI